MGVVYKAEDTKLERTVALKFLAAHLLNDDEAKQRFLREAKAAAALHHPNICTVHEIYEADGKTFLAMAYLKGETLEDRIAKGPLSLKDALDIGRQIADGLEAAHKEGGDLFAAIARARQKRPQRRAPPLLPQHAIALHERRSDPLGSAIFDGAALPVLGADKSRSARHRGDVHWQETRSRATRIRWARLKEHPPALAAEFPDKIAPVSYPACSSACPWHLPTEEHYPVQQKWGKSGYDFRNAKCCPTQLDAGPCDSPNRRHLR